MLLPRTPLPPEPGPVDSRDYRLFTEAIRFAAAHVYPHLPSDSRFLTTSAAPLTPYGVLTQRQPLVP